MTDKSRRATIDKLLGIFGICLVLFGLDYYISRNHNSDVLTVGIWLLFLYLVYRVRTQFIVKYMYMLYIQISSLIGVFCIENTDIYLDELAVDSSDCNAFLPLAFTMFLFFMAILFADVLFSSDENKKSPDLLPLESVFTSVITIVAFGLAALMLLHILPTAPAFLQEMDRFLYASEYIDGIWMTFQTVFIYILPVVVVGFVAKKARRWISLATILMFFIYLFWTGHKFGLFLATFYYMLPALLYQFKINYKRWIKYIAVSVACLIAMAAAVNFLIYRENDFVAYLSQRLAQQGQLWWKTYEMTADEPGRIDELGDELEVFFTSDPDVKAKQEYGIYKIMKLTTPEYICTRKLATGSRYACGTCPSLYYYFKLPGMIVILSVLGVAFAFLVNQYYRSVQRKEVLESVVYGRLIMVFTEVLSQADFDTLFSKRTVLFILILFVIKWVRYRSPKLVFPVVQGECV